MNQSTMIALRILLQAYPNPDSTFEITGLFLRGDYRPDFMPLLVANLIVPAENERTIVRYRFADGAKELLDDWEYTNGPALWEGPLEGQDQRMIRFLLQYCTFKTGHLIDLTGVEYTESLDGLSRYRCTHFFDRMIARGLLVPLRWGCYRVTAHLAAMCRELTPADWETLQEEERQETREKQERIFKRAADLRK